MTPEVLIVLIAVFAACFTHGAVGFGNAMCLNGMAKEQPDWTKAAETLGSDYLIKQTTTKNHAACGHVHAAVDGVLLIARENGLTPTDVKEIRVGSYQKAEELCGNIEPKTAFEAKFFGWAAASKLTLLTVAHNPELKAHHTHVLALDGSGKAALPYVWSTSFGEYPCYAVHGHDIAKNATERNAALGLSS